MVIHRPRACAQVLSARKVLIVVTISVEEALAKLEQLRAETAEADPFQPAPPIWIAELHRALSAWLLAGP